MEGELTVHWIIENTKQALSEINQMSKEWRGYRVEFIVAMEVERNNAMKST